MVSMIGDLAQTTCVLLLGLAPSIYSIRLKTLNPNSVLLLGQRAVAVSRLLRDVVAGVPNPSTFMRHNEFNRLAGIPETNFETFACQENGYAITHLFLQDYDDGKIMSFCNENPASNLTEGQILEFNKKIIGNYKIGTKNLKLVWEISEKTKNIIEAFKKLRNLGNDEVLTDQHAGESFSLYVLNVPKGHIEQFKQDVKDINIL